MRISTLLPKGVAAVAFLGFVAALSVAASTAGWLPLRWFIDGTNSNQGGSNPEPFLPSDLGLWTFGIGMSCFIIGFLLWAYLESRNSPSDPAA